MQNRSYALDWQLQNCGLKSDFFISIHTHYSTAYTAYYKYYAPYNKKYNPHICIQHNAYRNIENCIDRAKHKAVQQTFFPARRVARKAEAKAETPPITAAAVPSIGSDGKKPSFKIIKAQTAISTAENSTENRRPKNSFLKFSIEKAP